MVTEAPDVLHVDLDAFYASVEASRDPSLAGRPLIVGGTSARGVVLSCSYEARAAGVRNGMPAMRARRLCPRAAFVAPDFSAYRERSKAFRAILDAFTPLVEPLSLDEAFCDVSAAHTLFGSTAQIGRRIRQRVAAEVGVTCSVGAGPTKLVSKLASRACKPDGMLVVADVEAFLRPLPVEGLWGVGESTADACRRLGLRTVGDLAGAPRSLLVRTFGEAAGSHLAALAHGSGDRTVVPDSEARSIGAEETFEVDVGSNERLRGEILRLSDRVASRLVAGDLAARTITLKIRLASFETHTRSKTLSTPTSDVWTISRVARESLDGFRRGRQLVRLLGVTASGLVRGPVSEQLSFDPRPRYADAERAMTRVRRRFGRESLGLAGLLDEPPRDP